MLRAVGGLSGLGVRGADVVSVSVVSMSVSVSASVSVSNNRNPPFLRSSLLRFCRSCANDALLFRRPRRSWCAGDEEDVRAKQNGGRETYS